MVAPVAGSTPIRNPITVPRRIGKRLWRHSSRVGIDVADGRDRLRHGLLPTLDEHLADAEQRHRQHDETDAVEQPQLTEGEARDAGLLVDADGADQQAEQARRQAL